MPVGHSRLFRCCGPRPLPQAATVLTVLAVAVLWSTAAAQAENWPAWRGPSHNGVSGEQGIAVKWDSKTNVAWRLQLPGSAGATPVVWGDRVFLTSVAGGDDDSQSDRQLVLMAVSTQGKELWRQVIGKGDKQVRGDEGNAASPSPVTDGKHVWSMMANGALACFTVEGKPVWAVDLQERYGPFRIAFGMTATPVLAEGMLFIQLIHGDGKAETQEALVVALDSGTGKEVWRKDRITGATNENEHSYASPVLYSDAERKLLLTHGADYTIASDLATGDEVFRLGGLNPHDDPKRAYHRTLRFVASPAAVPGLIVVPTAKNGPVFAIRPEFKGDLTGRQEALVWKRDDNTPDVPSPLIHDGLVYLCRENGNLLCLEAETGEVIYQERTHRHRHRASPVYADGHLYLTARDGKVTVVRAGREFEIVSQNDLGEAVSASPAISGGTLYLRSFESLWAIRGR